jgi:hypothetical protein
MIMRKVELRKIQFGKIRILNRVLNSSMTMPFAKALRLINDRADGESSLQVYPDGLTSSCLRYDEELRASLQLVELERQKANAISLARVHWIPLDPNPPTEIHSLML